MRRRLLAVVVVLACPVVVWADVFLPRLGGPGGGQFIARCPQGQLLAGFELRTGDDVDAVRPLCVAARRPTEGGPIEPYRLMFGGGGGSNTTQVVCPNSKPVVIGLEIGYEGAKSEIVNNVHLFCGVADSKQNPRAEPDAIFDGPNQKASGRFLVYAAFDKQDCPAGLVAVGAHGKTGDFVDSIGLICGEPQRTLGSVGKVKTPRAGGGLGNPGKRRTPSGPSGAAIIYGLSNAPGMLWYRHSGAAPGKTGTWIGKRQVGSGAGYARLFTAGGDLYALGEDGTLSWLRHRGKENGTAVWDQPIELGGDWNQYAQVVPAENGIVYSISGDGIVLWHQNTGWADGVANWIEPIQVAEGWTDVKRIFSGGDGVLYVVTNDGNLWWRRHDGRDQGTDAWAGPQQIGTGWGNFLDLFSPGGGVIYAVEPGTTDLIWYRYLGYQTGQGKAWEGPMKVGTSWGEFRSLAAMPAQ